MNVLFVNLPTIPLSDIEANLNNQALCNQAVGMPLGIMYISSYLKRNATVEQVGLLDYVVAMETVSEYRNVSDFIINIASQNVVFIPDVLAISLNFSTSYKFFRLCLHILSRIWPKAVVVVGGVHATNTTETLLEISEVDYVFRGEAELSFTEFVNQLSLSDEIKIQGVYSKRNLFDSTELSKWPTDIDDLGFPDWQLIDMEKYVTSRGRRRELGTVHRMASLFTTRGCPFQCTFCSAHTVHGRTVRYRSVKNIIEEIIFLNKEYGVSLFIPEDDLFTANRERVLSLLRSIKRFKIPNFELQLPAGLSINKLDKEIIDELIDAGLKVACLAIESGSEYVQKHVIKKNCNLDKARQIVKLLKSKGVIIRCFFIFGFPNETIQQMQETVDYAKSLEIDWCVLSTATPLVGSEMYKQFIDKGCIEDNDETWENTVFDKRQFDTPEISAEELNAFVYRTNLDCNFINNLNKVNGHYKKAIIIYKDIVDVHPFHVIAWYCIIECYKKLGDIKQVKCTSEYLQKIIQNDKRAMDMFEKYGSLMIGFSMNNKF